MAQVGARVLLVDGDLRNPSLSRALAPRAKRGILEVISGKSSLGGRGMDRSVDQLGIFAGDYAVPLDALQ